MAALSWSALLAGLIVSSAMVASPRVMGWLALRRDSQVIPLERSDPKTQRDYRTVMRVLGACGLVLFGGLAAAKLLLT